ncbi:hypothetical protein BU17DRAFT_71834 [Hysterangium stoloniferum]|nr:hypothetical protein BU17DRAFT_71834 [Hysterangium stoloniferum]
MPLEAFISQHITLNFPPTNEDDPSHVFVNQYGTVSIVAAGTLGGILLSVRKQKIAIHVTPPAVPLKSILIRHCPNYPSSSGSEVESCRISITSTQLSNAIGNLPKAYDSFTIDGYEENYTLKSTRRIGPSPSDFLNGLVGADDANFNHDTFSTASESLCFWSSPRIAQCMRHSHSAGVFSRPQMEPLLPLPVLSTLLTFPPPIVVRSPYIYKQSQGSGILGNRGLELESSLSRSYEKADVHKGLEDHATFTGERVLF